MLLTLGNECAVLCLPSILPKDQYRLLIFKSELRKEKSVCLGFYRDPIISVRDSFRFYVCGRKLLAFTHVLSRRSN